MSDTRATLCGILALTGLTLAACDRKGDDASCSAAMVELDGDGDGFISSDASLPKACDGDLADALELAGLSSGDCADADAEIYPGAAELCDDGIDQDCDGSDAVIMLWYDDLDGDGYGDPLTGQEVCKPPSGASDNGEDCDDADAEVNPGAVETICGDPEAVRDLNCDHFTDCAVAGNLDAEDWAPLGVSVGLPPGSGRAMDADETPGGAVLVGGENSAWKVTYSAGALSGEEISVSGSVSAGAGVSFLGDVDEDGLPDFLIGDPDYGGTEGRLTLTYTAGDTGAFVGPETSQHVGATFASADGFVAAARFLERDWRVYFILPDALPAGGASLSLSTSSFPDADYQEAAGSENTPPALSAISISSSWLVAVGQPEDTSDSDRVFVQAITEGDSVKLCTINDSSDTLGTSVLLSDIDGDGLPDLIAGDPGAQTAYVWSDVLACAGATISTRNADYNAFASIARLGETLAAVPDVNGDGIDDLLIGGVNGAALVLGFDAATDRSSALTAYATIKGTGGFGASVASTDLNEDGYADLLFGATSTGQLVALWGGP